MRRLGYLCLVIAVTAAPVMARHGAAGCGTSDTTPAEVLFLHRQAQRARAARLRSLAAAPATASTNRDIGNVAIIEGADGAVETINQFDLDQATLTFTPAASGTPRYRYAYSGLGYDSSAADQGSPVVALGDDDARQFTLPFTFRFYGTAYTQVFLNSDGNLTFTAAESASSSRSLGRMTGGPPRIAPLFDDLDPSQPSGSVRYYADASHVVFSWVNVPEWVQSGIGTAQTFQVSLYPDGSIQFSYSGVTPASAVVGIAPGSAAPGTSVVSFHDDPSADYPAAVAESFVNNTPVVDIVTVAQKFYETHEDAYDYLVIYNNMGIDAMAGAVAYESTVRSSGAGYSVAPGDYGAQYGSAARLRSVMNMGRLDNYPVDPNAVVPLRAGPQDTPLTVLGHESGHLFLAFASIPDPGGSTAKPMIGYGGSHWSFVFNSEASLDEGEQINDLGGGQFVTGTVTKGFAPLDRYLMGFAPSTDVADTFVALNPNVSPLGHPLSGYFFTGTKFPISVNDVIQAVGRRTPDYTVAQHRFRFGFVLLVAPGSEDLSSFPDDVQQVETYRQQFVAAYTKFSANLGAADTTLNLSLRLSLFPAAGVVAGGSATATITVQTPPKTDLAVQLSAPAGFAQAPAQVTIAAGATSASFTVSGTKAGVEELLATPADSTYETAFARVQVAAPSQLTLRTASSAAPGSVAVQLTDVNGLSYPGARIVAATTSGSVTPAIATADATGFASFQWTPGGDAVSQLKLSVEAAPTVTLTLNAGSAVPVISGVVNAASFVAGGSPGSLATFFGVNLTGATVLLNGTDVRPSYASDIQVNFYIPAETPLGANVVTVTTPSGLQASSTVTLVTAQPGIFSGAVVRADTRASALTTPVSAGDYIEIYCTGLGPTKLSSDGLYRTTSTPVVYLGATTVTPSFSGLAPGFVGLYQVDAQIPAGLVSGTLPLVITSGTAYSNEVKIAVQ